MQNLAFRISALLGFAGVALGAFGAHGLKEILTRNDAMETWQTAVLYHLVHAVVLMVLAISGGRWRSGPWWSFFLGILVFSGSLYVLSLTGVKRLGMVTPFGGVAFLIGWLWLVVQGRAMGGPSRPVQA